MKVYRIWVYVNSYLTRENGEHYNGTLDFILDDTMCFTVKAISPEAALEVAKDTVMRGDCEHWDMDDVDICYTTSTFDTIAFQARTRLTTDWVIIHGKLRFTVYQVSVNGEIISMI